MRLINSEKIDSKISPQLIIALENYMAINRRNKSEAIRLLLEKALELEKLFDSITGKAK